MADETERQPRHITVPLLAGEPWLKLYHNGHETHIGETDLLALLGLANRLVALEAGMRLLLQRQEEITQALVTLQQRLGLT